MTNPNEKQVTADGFLYAQVQATIKIITHKVHQFQNGNGIIEYGVSWTNTKARDEVFTVKTPIVNGIVNIKPYGTQWNINGELRTDVYKSGIYKEERTSPFHIYVEPFEWLSEYNPHQIMESLPF